MYVPSRKLLIKKFREDTFSDDWNYTSVLNDVDLYSKHTFSKEYKKIILDKGLVDRLCSISKAFSKMSELGKKRDKLCRDAFNSAEE